MLSRNNSRVIMVQPVPTDNSVMPSTIIPTKQNGFGGNRKTMSPYEYQIHQLEHDPRTSKEVLLGKRVRFYHIKGTLGTGNFSKVRLGVHLLTKEKVAIKIIDKSRLDERTRKLLSQEISCMERLDHPNIIRLYEVIDSLPKMHVVMEYAPGGELFERIMKNGYYAEEDARPIFAQVVSAIKHIHKNGVIHRDLKAENVLFAQDGTVKVGDFGFSTLSHADELLSTFCGSPPYAAPELFQDKQYAGDKVDIWALGILLYFMLVAKTPFTGDTIPVLQKCILKGQFTFPSHLSADSKTLIQGILTQNPSERYAIDDIVNSTWMGDAIIDREDSGLGSSESTLHRGAETLHEQLQQRLTELGVPFDDLNTLRQDMPRDSISGTYRIILHQLQRNQVEQTAVCNSPNSCYSQQQNDINTGRKNVTSKLCIIL